MVAAGEFGKIGCDKCREQPELKKMWQCEGGPEKWEILRGTPDAFEIDRCPLTYLNKDIENAVFLYWHYKEGRLPVAGGVIDQNASGLAAFNILERYIQAVNRK